MEKISNVPSWENIFREYNEQYAAIQEETRAENVLRNRERAAREAEIAELRRERNEALNREANAQIQRNIECRDRFKNNSGKLQLPPSLRDLPENQIYFYHGHGGTVCDDLGYPIIKQVPDNCIYITQTVCGIVNTLKEEIVTAFLDPAKAHIWKDPIAHLDEIRSILGLHDKYATEGIHIHLPGCSYVESSYQPFGYHESKKGAPEKYHKIYFSGIMDLETAHEVPDTSPYIEGVKFDHVDYVDYGQVKDSFQFSFFPKVEETEEYVSPSEITDMFLLHVNEEGKVDISDVVTQSGIISDTVPVSKIMETYPGIHFNFLCRSFGKENTKCRGIRKKALTHRRRHSAVVQGSEYNTFKKLVNIGSKFPENAKGVANDHTIKNYLESISFKLIRDGEFAKFYDLYDSIRYEDDLDETKEYFRSIFKDPYLMKFFELFSQMHDSKNENERNDKKKLIGDHIRILMMNPHKAFDSRRYGFENEILGNIAWAASSLDDKELFDYACELGHIDLSSGFTYNSNSIRDAWDKRCKSVYNEAYKRFKYHSDSNNEERRGGRRRKRRTMKKKRT